MKAISSHFAAQNQLISSSTPTSLTVECPNLGGMIQSYDGISQKRRPIVAVIPAMEQKNGLLTYQPGYPPFIDLNNRFPIQLSKLEVRLLSSFDDTEVNLEHPGTSMTFALNQNQHQHQHQHLNQNQHQHQHLNPNQHQHLNPNLRRRRSKWNLRRRRSNLHQLNSRQSKRKHRQSHFKHCRSIPVPSK